jgi:hypothetical protein
MKFETLILNSLFSACLLICLMMFGAMVTAKPAAAQIAVNHAQVVTNASST